MYGVPLDVDWLFMVGRAVEQIAIGVWDVQIKMTDGVSILIVSPFEHLASAKSVPGQTLAQQGATLISLLKKSIQSVRAEGRTRLRIEFDNDEVVTLIEHDKGYECFSIWNKDGPIVV